VQKIPAGVGPRFPQVVVLVGATGDLSRRKLLPGLFHLASSAYRSTISMATAFAISPVKRSMNSPPAR
jgi:glucose-6-phosphate 1-dehydrogenase